MIVTLVDGEAADVLVEEIPAQEVTGQLVAIYHVSIDFSPSLRLYTGDGQQRVLLSPATSYVRDGRRVELDDLQAGDRLRIRLVNGIVDRILVEERPEAVELTGTIRAIADDVITLRVNGRQDRKLILAEEAVLTLGEGKIRVSDLRMGDRVTVKARGDVVLQLEVERRTGR